MERDRWLESKDGGLHNLKVVAKLSIESPLSTVEVSVLKLHSPLTPLEGAAIFEANSGLIQWLYNDIIFWMNSVLDEEDTVYRIRDHADRYLEDQIASDGPVAAVIVDFGVQPDPEDEDEEDFVPDPEHEEDFEGEDEEEDAVDIRHTTAEAAEYLGLKMKTLENMRYKGGKGPEFFKEGRVYYLQRALDAWLSEQ